jgi:hypothetical protein
MAKKSILAELADGREVLADLNTSRVDDSCQIMTVQVTETDHRQGKRDPFFISHKELICSPIEREILKKHFNLEVLKKKKELGKKANECHRRQAQQTRRTFSAS